MFGFGKYGKRDDASLVKLTEEGDARAFRELLERHQRTVHVFAYRFLGDEAEAADIGQETFLRLYRNAGQYKPDAKLKTYLLHIARNLCIDAARKKKPMLLEVLPEQAVGDDTVERISNGRTVTALEEAVHDLPENQRMAIILRHGNEMAYAEIAEQMNTSVSAVESLLVRARKTLRSRLGRLLED